MKLLKRDEFKELLESNPGKSYAFYEWTPSCLMGDLHVTDGDAEHPTFGAWSPDACGDDFGDPFFEASYDWNLLEDDVDALYAVLEQSDLEVFREKLNKCTGL